MAKAKTIKRTIGRKTSVSFEINAANKITMPIIEATINNYCKTL